MGVTFEVATGQNIADYRKGRNKDSPPLRNPYVNLASPIHRKCSVPIIACSEEAAATQAGITYPSRDPP